METSSGTFLGKTVVIAIGATPRTLGIPVEQALVGRGVAVHMAEELYLEKRFKNLLIRGLIFRADLSSDTDYVFERKTADIP